MRVSKKLTVLILVGLLLAVGACSYPTGASGEKNTPLNYRAIKIAGTPLELVLSGQSLTDACIEKVKYANKEAPFICPAIIEHNTFKRGYRYSWDIVVYSGNGGNTTFDLVATESPDPRPGYVSADKKLLDLVTIQDKAVRGERRISITANFKPYETRVFKVTLEIPRKAEMPPKWEFRIKVKNKTQGGNVQIALNQRCLINIKE